MDISQKTAKNTEILMIARNNGKVKSDLISLMEEMGMRFDEDSTKVRENFMIIADQLSRLAGKDPPWTWKYVHSVYKGYEGCKPSKRFGNAVSALAQVVDDVVPGVAGAEIQNVLVYPDQIPEGIFVPRNAKAVHCANPGCPVVFIRTHPRQIYHDPECRKMKR